MHFFFANALIFPLTFFLKTQRRLFVVILFKTEGSKEFNFGKIFILLYLQITCYRDMQLTCVSIYQYRSSYIIKTLTGWKFYAERKHQGIQSFYPKRIIDKKN